MKGNASLFPVILLCLTGCISQNAPPPAGATPSPAIPAPGVTVSPDTTPAPAPSPPQVKEELPSQPGSPLPGASPLTGRLGDIPVPSPVSGEPAPTVSPAAPDTEKSSAAEEKVLDLFLQTLPLDIQTAGYYELVNWCRRLGIDDAGDRKTLQNKLYKHYGVAAPEPAKEGEKKGKEIDIIAADISRYFTQDKEDTEEKYIRLDGNVSVTVKENDVVHEIRAQRIIVNQEMKLLVAEGDIEYKKTQKGDNPEIYRGESLSFNLKSLNGIFYNGVGETEKEVGDEKAKTKLKFLYSGKRIVKLENDNIMIDQAVITSSHSLEYPNWKITASRIWVLAPEEWAASNAVLYIGEIPFLMLPFFFNPGDELFFNPVLGFRSREGNFVQTTTYLVGEKSKKADQNSLSLINIGNTDKKNYKTELQGLFLRKVKESGAASAAPAAGQQDYLKVMLDIYSRLGYFAGLDLNFTNWGKFLGGIGVSRTIILDTEGNYTTFAWDDETGRAIEEWNNTSFLGVKLPIRFGFEGSFRSPPLGPLNFSTTFESYSDPFFSGDFYNRSENVDFIKLLEGNRQEEAVTPSSKTNLSWIINSSLNFFKDFLAPYITALKLTKINLEFYSKSKNAVDPGGSSPFLAYDPARMFFLPDKNKIPEVQLELTGSFLQLPLPSKTKATTVKAATGAKPDPGKGYKLPYTVPAAKDKAEEKEHPRDELKLPSVKGNGNGITPVSTESKMNLLYEIRPRLQQENVFLSNGWNSTTDIDYSEVYSIMEYQTPGALSFDTSLWGDFLKLTGSIRFDWKELDSYKSPDLTLISDSDWINTYLTQDYRGTYATVNTAPLLTFKPFFAIYELRNSTVSYALNWLLYNHKFDKLNADNTPAYLDESFKWDKTSITNHKIDTSLTYDAGGKPVKWTTTNQLPPLDGKFTTSLDFFIWELHNVITYSIKEESDAWKYDPLTPPSLQSTLNLSWLNLYEKLNYNMDENSLNDSTTTLKLFNINGQYLLEQELAYNFIDNEWLKYSAAINWGGLKVSFLMDEQIPRYYNHTLFGWTNDNPLTPEVETGVKVFMPSTFNLQYAYDLNPVYFWKNRVNLSTTIRTNWQFDFNEVSKSNMLFSLTLKFNIHKFMELEFVVNSENHRLYYYFPFLFDKVKTDDDNMKNIFIDLLRSFNFFNENDRYESEFKLKDISIDLKHHLEDWDLTFNLKGKYEASADGLSMEWKPVITIEVKWVPIPEMKKNIIYDNAGLNIEG